MILDGNAPASIAAAVHALHCGQLVGMPTETVYGLAANAHSDAAVAAIFAAKGRPSDHPLIVHVASKAALGQFADALPDFAAALVDAFWPGPLTVILPRRTGVATAAAGGQSSIGLRCPSHPVAQALLTALAASAPAIHGLAAPSANRFGRVSPTTAQHVQDELGDGLLILDGGACQIGIESSIVDCTRGAPVLLRPGGISRAQMEAVCGCALLEPHQADNATPRASGTLPSHYAPLAQVRLMNASALRTGLELLGADAAHLAVYSRTPLKSASQNVILQRMPDDAAVAAQQLFAVLRSFDDAGVRLIWVETPPQTPDWDGVRDRLQRAAA